MVDGSSAPQGGEPAEEQSATSALLALLRTYPSVDACPSERVEWYFAKADVLRLIAEEGGPDAEQARALAAEADAEGCAVARSAIRRAGGDAR